MQPPTLSKGTMMYLKLLTREILLSTTDVASNTYTYVKHTQFSTLEFPNEV